MDCYDEYSLCRIVNDKGAEADFPSDYYFELGFLTSAQQHARMMGRYCEDHDVAQYRKYQERIDDIMTTTKHEVHDIIANALTRISELRNKQWSLTGSYSQQMLDKRRRLGELLQEAAEKQRGKYLSKLIEQAGSLFEQLEIIVSMAGVERIDIPHHLAGIYFLLNREDGIIEYIGQSINIKQRLSNRHDRYDRQRHVICVAELENRAQRKETELILIRELSPCLNRAGVVAQNGLAWTIKKERHF